MSTLSRHRRFVVRCTLTWAWIGITNCTPTEPDKTPVDLEPSVEHEREAVGRDRRSRAVASTLLAEWAGGEAGSLPAGFAFDGEVLRAEAGDHERRFVVEGNWGDLELRFSFRLDDGGSGGVDVRIDGDAARGLRYALDGSPRGYTGGVFVPSRDAWLMPLDRNVAARVAYRPGEWNDARIEVVGARIRTFINEVPAAEAYSADALHGGIAFVVAAGSGSVAWRDVTIDSAITHQFETPLAAGSWRGWDRVGHATWRVDGPIFGVESFAGDASVGVLTRRRYRSFVLRTRVAPHNRAAHLLIHATRRDAADLHGVEIDLTASQLGQLRVPEAMIAAGAMGIDRRELRLDVTTERGRTDVAPRSTETRDDSPEPPVLAAPPNTWPRLDVVVVPGKVMTFVDGRVVDERHVDDTIGGSVGVVVEHPGPTWMGAAHFEFVDLEPAFDPEPAWREDLDDAPVRSPLRSLAKIRVAPGFRARLVAAEPFVVDPVGLGWDEHGTLWALEQPAAPVMRSPMLVRLDDEDGDGRVDARTEVLTDLDQPTAFVFVDEGVLVLDAPNLWWCPQAVASLDCRGRRRLGFVGTRDAEADERVGDLRFGLDNWLYTSNWPRRLLVARGRVRGDDTIARGRGGLARDDDGRLYYGDDRRLLAVDLLAAEYAQRDALAASDGDGLGFVGVTLIARDEPLSTVRTNGLAAGAERPGVLDERGRLRRATSLGAIEVYRGTAFPAEFVGDAFVAEPEGNVVMHVALESDGAAVRAEHRRYWDADFAEREFVASTDERFRPTALRTGPDGALYIADAYRAVMTPVDTRSDYLRDEVLARHIDESPVDGRIYRIVVDTQKGDPRLRVQDDAALHDDTSTRAPLVRAAPPRPSPGERKLEELDELIAALSDADGSVRDQAQRQLIAWPRHHATTALREAKLDSPLGRVHRLWALRGRRALRVEIIIEALGDSDPRVRVAALRNADPLLWSSPAPDLRAAVERLRVDPEPSVRLQLVATLGEIGRDEAVRDALAAVLTADCEPAWLRAAALSSLGRAHADMLGRLLGDPRWHASTPGRQALLTELARRAVLGWTDPAGNLDAGSDALQMFAERIDAMPGDDAVGWQRTAVLAGIEAAVATLDPERRPTWAYNGASAEPSGAAARLLFRAATSHGRHRSD